MKEKRGISAVVATVLIILLTVSAVGIIWVAIVPLISSDLDFANIDSRLEIIESGGYTAYDSVKEIVSIQVERRGEGGIDAMMIYIEFNGDTFSEIVLAPLVNSRKTYVFNLSSYDGFPNEISVAPIVYENERAEVGPISSTIIVPKKNLNVGVDDITDQIFGDNNDLSSVNPTGGTGGNSGVDNVTTCSGGYSVFANRSCGSEGVCINAFEMCQADGNWGSCNYTGTYESPELTLCSDGLDNDCDGDIDVADSSCVGGPSLPAYSEWMVGSLQAHWAGDGDATDSSSFGNDGVLVGEANASEPGIYGNSFSFDGNNDFVNLNYDPRYSFNDEDMSISVWIKSIAPFGSYGAILTNGAFNSGFGLSLTNFGNIQANLNEAFGDSRYLSGTDFLGTGLWHHVVLAVDAAPGGSENASLYLDGVLINSTDVSDITTISSSKIYMGTSYFGIFDFNGSIDELMIFNKTLNSTEILELYSPTY